MKSKIYIIMFSYFMLKLGNVGYESFLLPSVELFLFKNSSAPQLNFTLIGVALELTIKQEA